MSGWRTGLDRLLDDGLDRLSGRRYGLLSHGASVAFDPVSADLRPIHLALAAAGRPPAVLFGPEHGFYGVEQDMVASEDATDPWLGVAVRSLYGDSEDSLRPDPGAFRGLDLLLVDLQDVGARYYTYVATAVWAAEAALEAGCEVWVLDRPNPLGGTVEGNLLRSGYESFVGAFRTPQRHGLTLAELVRLEARRRGWDASPEGGLEIWEVGGWVPADGWSGGGGGTIRATVGTARPWVPASPNMPTLPIAAIYPGLCLVEATELSEGRGTTRPFQLVGAPGLDGKRLAARLSERRLPGVAFLPTRFKPQFQKHAGRVCEGVEILVTGEPGTPDAVEAPVRLGVEVLFALREIAGDAFAWRRAPYEFVADRPAIDLLAGTDALRRAVDDLDRDALETWLASWPEDEKKFQEETAPLLLYPR